MARQGPQARHGAGLNGIGCKLANIFAARLTVEVTDATTHYQQTFTSNMREREAPEIAPIGARAPHTIRVAVAPDAARHSWSDDVRAVCARRAYDIALCTAVRVLLRRGDGELVHLKPDLSRYAPWCAEPLDLSMPAYRVLIGPSATPRAPPRASSRSRAWPRTGAPTGPPSSTASNARSSSSTRRCTCGTSRSRTSALSRPTWCAPRRPGSA
jgi:hypothetical protein